MGKTLGAILTIGAAIAINVIPGVGQVISGTLFGAMAGVTGTVGAAAATAFSVSQALGSLITLGITVSGIQSLGGVLGLMPSSGKPEQVETGVKMPRPPRISGYGASRLHGAKVLFATAADGTAVDVDAIHDGELSEVLALYLNDDLVTLTGDVVDEGDDGRYRDGKVKLFYTNGNSPGTAFTEVIAKLPDIWTTDHRGDGVVMLAQLCEPIKSKHFLDCYPNGAPTASMAARWQKCPDPFAADPTDPSAWTWTECPVRHLLHYKLVRERVDYASKIAPAIAYWQAASTICAEPIPLAAGGMEARYRSCVAHKHTDSHGSVTAAILETCDGWIAPGPNGALIIHVGKFYEPTVSIGPDDIIAFEWSGVGVDDDEAVNEITLTYVSAEHDYSSVEAEAWRDEVDISARGQVLADSFEPQIPSAGQARRLAKRRAARANAPRRGSVTTNIAGRRARGERFINLRLAEAGTVFYDGPAEIVAVTRNMATGGISFDWVEVSPDVDDWSTDLEGRNPAPAIRPSLEPLAAPTITAVAGATDGSGGLIVTVSGPARDDLTWFAHVRPAGGDSWSAEQMFEEVASGGGDIIVRDVLSGGDLELEVSYSVGDGRRSPWSDPESVTIDTIEYDGGSASV